MLYVNPMDARAGAAVDTYRNGIGRAGAKSDPAKEKKALEEFEHLFLFQLVREMRKGVPEDPLFGKSGQTDYMEEMLDDHYAGVMAASGQFGIAKEMASQIHAFKKPEDFTPAPLRPLGKHEHIR